MATVGSRPAGEYDKIVSIFLVARAGQSLLGPDLVVAAEKAGLVSGHINDEKTPHLRHVGCESCHGPGSGHAADPKDKKLLLALSQWKSEKPEAQLPAKADLERLAAGQEVQLTLTEKQTLNAVGTMCLRCHDTENDPKFDVNKSMPKIWHSGLTPKVVGK